MYILFYDWSYAIVAPLNTPSLFKEVASLPQAFAFSEPQKLYQEELQVSFT